MIVAQGMGWPYLDDDEIMIVIVSLAVATALLWGICYIVWNQIQSEIRKSRDRRKKEAQAAQAAREARIADLEWRQQMRADGWPPGIENLPTEQIREIVQQAMAVHYRVAAALNVRPQLASVDG